MDPRYTKTLWSWKSFFYTKFKSGFWFYCSSKLPQPTKNEMKQLFAFLKTGKRHNPKPQNITCIFQNLLNTNYMRVTRAGTISLDLEQNTHPPQKQVTQGQKAHPTTHCLWQHHLGHRQAKSLWTQSDIIQCWGGGGTGHFNPTCHFWYPGLRFLVWGKFWI